MKYPVKTYVKVLDEVLGQTPPTRREEVLENFVKLIYKNGDGKYADRIVRAVHVGMVKAEGNRWVKIEVANKELLPRIKEVVGLFSKNDFIEVVISPSLVAGIKITIDGESELDNSLARKLKKLFQA